MDKIHLSAFVLSQAEADHLMSSHGLASKEDLLRALIGPASAWAITPTSNYHVGAAGLGLSGRIFIGVNVELPSLPIGNSIHAEQFLAANAWVHGERGLAAIAVSAAPCGHCRQFYCELSGADSVKFLFGPPNAPPKFLDELLPLRFGPQDLLEGGLEPLLLEPRCNRLTLKEPPSTSSSSNPACSPQLVEEALKGANRAHAIYTKCPSGVALQLKSGRTFWGGNIESAAYNPTLPAFQSALVHAISEGAFTSFDDIAACALVEVEGASVRTEGMLRYLLAAVAPTASLVVRTAVQEGAGRAARTSDCSSPLSHL